MKALVFDIKVDGKPFAVYNSGRSWDAYTEKQFKGQMDGNTLFKAICTYANLSKDDLTSFYAALEKAQLKEIPEAEFTRYTLMNHNGEMRSDSIAMTWTAEVAAKYKLKRWSY